MPRSKLAPLTQKQQNFVRLFIQLGNATIAAKEAGFAPKYANRHAAHLLSMPKIQQEIERNKSIVLKTSNELVKRMAKSPIIDFNGIIDKLLTIANDENVEAKDKIAALREINAMQGNLAPTKSIHASVSTDLDKVRELTNQLLNNQSDVKLLESDKNESIEK